MVKQRAKAAMPRLRFPEFRTMAAWREVPLERVAQRTSTKNSDGHVTRVLTNSAEFGVLDQRDYFDKDIATAGKVDGYYVVGKGDYVYNPRTSAIAPVGPISRNNVGEGVMSPLYTVFRFSEDKTDFYEHYFRSSGWHSYLRSAASTGARHDRMSITTSAFMRMPVPVPSREEQQKIADCLTSLDEVIAAQGRKVEALEAHKRGLMQQLFPREGETRPRLRFPEFRDAPDLEAKVLSELVKFSSGGTPSKAAPNYWGGDIPWISASSMHDMIIEDADQRVTKEAIGNGTRLARKGCILVLVRGSMLFKRVPICISTRDVAFNQDVKALAVLPDMVAMFLLYQLVAMSPRIPINETGIGAGKIETEVLENLEIWVPGIAEQQRIADCLSSLDTQITAETQQLIALKIHKQGLMQQLFPVPEAAGA